MWNANTVLTRTDLFVTIISNSKPRAQGMNRSSCTDPSFCCLTVLRMNGKRNLQSQTWGFQSVATYDHSSLHRRRRLRVLVAVLMAR